MVTRQQIEAFHHFALVKLEQDATFTSLVDMLQVWEEHAHDESKNIENNQIQKQAKWQSHLDELLALARPGNPQLDDTREGIYQDHR